MTGTNDAARRYDVIIVGAGPAGLFAAHHLCENTDLKVLMVEKGKDVAKRGCPISAGEKCKRCRPCHILSGVGGAGLFSDGKLNYIHKLGKTDLTQFMARSSAEKLIDETEAVFNRFGMEGPAYPTDMDAARELRKEAKKHGVDLLIIRQKHLGSDNLPRHIEGFTEHLRSRGVTIHTGETAREVLADKGRVAGLLTNRGEYQAQYVILAPGRVGAEWVGGLARTFNIPVSQRGIEVGVRVEVHQGHPGRTSRTSSTTRHVFHPDRHLRRLQVRTFCTNKPGLRDPGKLPGLRVRQRPRLHATRNSDNTNFALLSKVVLTEPVSDNQRLTARP